MNNQRRGINHDVGWTTCDVSGDVLCNNGFDVGGGRSGVRRDCGPARRLLQRQAGEPSPRLLRHE